MAICIELHNFRELYGGRGDVELQACENAHNYAKMFNDMDFLE